jgi:hypothetical protein
MNGDKIASIELKGGYKCTAIPKLTIEAPNKINVVSPLTSVTPYGNIHFANRIPGTATFTKFVVTNLKGSGYMFAPKITNTGGTCAPHGIKATSVIEK